MNIFYLDKNPKKAAQMMTDKHVVKMIVESAQLMSTCHRVLDGKPVKATSINNRSFTTYKHNNSLMESTLYKASNYNHPCALWLRESGDNYDWLYDHFCELSSEYQKRFNREHLTYTKLKDVIKQRPKNIPLVEGTFPELAMPENYRVPNDAVQSYRNYYEGEKLKEDKDKQRYDNLK
jgi:hypothetical protein